MSPRLRRLLAVGAVLALAGTLAAQAPGAAAPVAASAPVAEAGAAVAQAVSDDQVGGLRLTTAVEIAALLTILSLVPALVISVTSFTRIVIVLSFVRRSMAVNELPPNPVVIALSLFLTTFVMQPVFSRVYEQAYVPYRDGRVSAQEAVGDAWGELADFLVSNTRESEVELFLELSGEPRPASLSPESLPFRVVIPAFVLSELKTSFQMGFLLFLPFLLIDLVVASVLVSMGMFMLPPVMVSTPFKILLFVLVDGWHLVCESLVNSFTVT